LIPGVILARMRAGVEAAALRGPCGASRLAL